ncbi:MAG: hypothetical protein ACFFE8_00300 [Candidatus Heimdallarchaeota archaeon]
MSRIDLEGKRKRILTVLRQHRVLSASLGIFLVLFSIIAIGILSTIITVGMFPKFVLENFRIVRIENHTVYTDLSFTLLEELDYSVRANKITCTIQTDSTEGNVAQILATGSTIESLIFPKGSIKVENLSFMFDVPDLESLLRVLISDEAIIIQGQIHLEWGLTSPYKIELSGIDVDFFPSISILEIYPIYPGNILHVLVHARNFHGVTLNISSASFQLTSPEFGSFGTAYFENTSIPPGRSNVSLLLHSNASELTWLTERILNNGTIQASIRKFQGEFLFAHENINISVQDGPKFFWDDFTPSLHILGINNINISGGYFDVNLGFEGQPLWGYNLTCITFDFYHQLLNETLGSQIVGRGNFSETILVPRLSLAQIGIRITIIPEKVVEMLIIWTQTREINLDLRNGIICLQFYEVIFEVGFTSSL